MSPRHLSFVETGRSKPSPSSSSRSPRSWRSRCGTNTLLLAAGYAPRYRETGARRSGDALRGRVRAADARRPRPLPGRADRPAVEHRPGERGRGAGSRRVARRAARADRSTSTGSACTRMASPARTANFSEWAAHLVGQLRSLGLTGIRRCRRPRRGPGYPNVATRSRARRRRPTTSRCSCRSGCGPATTSVACSRPSRRSERPVMSPSTSSRSSSSTLRTTHRAAPARRHLSLVSRRGAGGGCRRGGARLVLGVHR